MRYTVVIEPTREAEYPGWYYAHVPALDLTTHGLGIEGAIKAARNLVTGWVAELRAGGQPVPLEGPSLVSQLEIPEGDGGDALHAA